MERNGFSLVPFGRTNPRCRSTRGVALVLVLSILLLITGFVLAFYSSVSSEMVSAKSYASGGSSKALADAATQVAIGTIRKATSQTSGSSTSGTDIAWASQPGMIRTWDSNGNPLTCYKLFSSDNVEAAAPYKPTTDNDPAFDTKPAMFTDLNAPVTDSSGTAHYPIIDPRGAAQGPDGKPLIAGFSITNPPSAAKVPDPAPMPVRWVYMLQDGTMTTPSSGDTTAAFTTNPPTAINPIVGRIAYWTDDDTCKVNVNTASEGVYWDMPRLATREDVGIWNGHTTQPQYPGLSVCQPATGEFQRYSGHPATTSLSPILGNLISATLRVPTDTTAPISYTSANGVFKTYYDLVPRISQGGSFSGTVIPKSNYSGQLAAYTPDSDRLFASVDEFMFKQPTDGTDTPRQVNLELAGAGDVGTVKTALEEARFFLTAHSSAPEVTIFNTPRVSMWPVWADNTKRTVLDNTLSFCASLPLAGQSIPSPYFFTRSNSRSTTADYAGRNVDLYGYLQKLMNTPVPGFGGTFGASMKDATGDDSAQVLTNIYDYIRCVNIYDTTTGAVNATPYTKPVRIGNGLSTWGGGEILPSKLPNGTQGFGRFATLSGMDIVFAGVNADPALKTTDPLYVIPAKVQAMVVPTFFCPMQGLPGMFPRVYYTISGLGQAGKFTLNGVSIFEQVPKDAIDGTNWIANVPDQQFVGRGMGSMISPRASLGKYGAFGNTGPGGNFSKDFGPLTSLGPTFGNVPSSGVGSGTFPFVSYSAADKSPNIPLVLPAAQPPGSLAPTKMPFVGGTLTVKLFAADTNELLQSFQMVFPDAPNLPVPKISIAPMSASPIGLLFGTLANPNVYTPGTPRFTGGGGGPTFSATDDVVRGVEIAGLGDAPGDNSSSSNTTAGDGRMVAGRAVVPINSYHAHKDWATTNMIASGMEDDDGSNSCLFPNPNGGPGPGLHGTLAAGIFPRNGTGQIPAYKYKSPYVPSRALGVTRFSNDPSSPGDWDTGYALLPDGAHMNMVDIGDGAYIDEVTAPINYYPNPRFPYVTKEDHFNCDRGSGSYFSPSRQVPSSMMLGSIPTGVQRFKPWQTLLFNPKPEDPNHPGRWSIGALPPDHLIADFFWMPVVEPYPISQPFSTAGKINLNYQIEPFNYITRSTGIYAVMKATKMMAIPVSLYNGEPKPLISDQAGAGSAVSSNPTTPFRYQINVDETIQGFEEKFATNDIFRSASQISEINLVPNDGSTTHTTGSMAAFWKAHTMTGDNLREKPYVDIYPRLTTKSNTYTVHFRVQVLQKSPTTAVNQWVEGKDQVISENRGSSAVERYLDSTAPNLPDFAMLMANNPSDPKLNLDKYYGYRVVSTKRFSPY